MKNYKSSQAKVERNNEIVKKHLDGQSFYSMSKEYGISSDRIARIFHEATDNKYKKTLVLKKVANAN